jgi:hypothetical protein
VQHDFDAAVRWYAAIRLALRGERREGALPCAVCGRQLFVESMETVEQGHPDGVEVGSPPCIRSSADTEAAYVPARFLNGCRVQ